MELPKTLPTENSLIPKAIHDALSKGLLMKPPNALFSLDVEILSKEQHPNLFSIGNFAGKKCITYKKYHFLKYK